MDKQIYYHFLSSQNAIDDLEKRRIKISTIDALNDPFEMVPYLRFRGLKRRMPYHKARREISKKYGFLCFSRDWSEPLLWSHYADKHKGIAIGFEILRDKVLKVAYSLDPIRKQIELTSDSKTNERLFLDLAKVKYRKWDYENETRILVKLEDCIKNGSYYFLCFDNRLKVKEIVLGCKFDHKKERGNIIKLTNQLGAGIIPTRQGWEDYKIHRCGTKTKQYQKIQII